MTQNILHYTHADTVPTRIITTHCWLLTQNSLLCTYANTSLTAAADTAYPTLLMLTEYQHAYSMMTAGC